MSASDDNEANTAAFDALERRMAMVDMISLRLGQVEDADSILTALSPLVKAYGAVMPSLALLDDERQSLRIIAMHDSSGTLVALDKIPIVDFPIHDHAHVQIAMQTPDEPLLVADVVTDTRLQESSRDAMKRFVLGAFAVLLLRHGGRYIGSLALGWVDPQVFSDDFRYVFLAIRPALSLALANYRLRQEIAQHMAERMAIIEQMQAERRQLQAQMQEAQNQAIAELSTPIIPLLDGIIIVPLIGSVDTIRARDIMRALLRGISTYRAQVVILDITGVPLVDSGVANHLNKTIMAARLKGTHTIITGISDAVAETIVDLGIDWSSLETVRDLQSGLRHALSRLNMRLESGPR